MRFPLIGKIAALGLVALSLTWALESVTRVAAERQGRLQEAQRSVAESLATSQALVGPVLQRSCTESWEVETGDGKDRKRTTEHRTFTLRAAPRRLALDGAAKMEPRYRGIFKVNGYALKATIAADWANTQALEAAPSREGTRLVCSAPVLWVAVTDARGLRDAHVTVMDRDLTVLPGISSPVSAAGFSATLADKNFDPAQPMHATVVVDLAGTTAFALAPVGESTRATLTADWPHPSFNGQFLPTERNVTDVSFQAQWEVGALASGAGRQLASGNAPCQPDALGRFVVPRQNTETCIDTFGVAFVDPVNPYVLSDRATKYGLLFIALTFVTIALVEVLRRVRVHPVQYLLVGSALVIFFLLLVSLSEHVPFVVAYGIASLACTALLTYYGVFVLRSVRGGLALGGGIALLYGALYVLLVREQTALVLGAILLFAVLAAVMRVTRNVDWYGVIGQMRADPTSPTGRG